MFARVYLAVFLAVPFALGGCASQVSFQALRPADLNVAGVQTLAVPDFQGQQPVAGIAQAELLGRLAKQGSYRLISQAELDRAAPRIGRFSTPETERMRMLEAARRLGADTILIGEANGRVDWGTQFGNVSISFGDPEVEVALDYKLLDVQSGLTRLNQQVLRTQIAELDHGSPATEEEVKARLAAECGTALVQKISPHEETVKVMLAREYWGAGANEISKGVVLAKNGQWLQARQRWEKAVEKDPNSHQANYNLGVAHEALGEFAAARHFYTVANGKEDLELYRMALQRVEDNRESYHLAMAQMHHNTPARRPPHLARLPQPGPQDFRSRPAAWRQAPQVGPYNARPPAAPQFPPTRPPSNRYPTTGVGGPTATTHARFPNGPTQPAIPYPR